MTGLAGGRRVRAAHEGWRDRRVRVRGGTWSVSVGTALAPHPHTVTVGEDWDSVVILSNVDLGRLGDLLRNAPPVTVGSAHGRLVTSRLLNAVVMDDGRVGIGAVTPDAVEAALAQP